MEDRAFDDNPSHSRAVETDEGSPDTLGSDTENKGRAVVYLVRNQLLIHSFGEYEVRTTLATRQAWRYRCSIWRHGREIRREFYPIVVDRTRQMRKVVLITDEMRLRFAMEAVDIHFSRCAALRKYLTLRPLRSSPLRYRVRPSSLAWVAFLCTVPLLAYWLWGHFNAGDVRTLGQSRLFAAASSVWNTLSNATPSPPPAKSPARAVQWEHSRVSYELPAGKRFTLPLPALVSSPEGVPVEVSLDPSGQRPNWLHFVRETLMISGHVPRSEINKTFHLKFRAQAGQEPESILQVFLTITKQKEPLAPVPRHSSGPSVGNALTEKDCLSKILKNEPC